MTIWWKTVFPLKSVTVSSSLRVFKQKLCGIFGGKCPVRHSELHFNCTESILDGKTLFLKKLNVFIFWDLERKILWLLQTFFLHFCQNGNIPRQNTFLNICSNISTFSIQFRYFRFKKITLLSQMVRRSCQKCNLRVRAII